jgi:hypothetical protein
MLEGSLVREAQLQNTANAMSDVITQLKHKLAECKETLECCVCMERSVSDAACLPVSNHSSTG